MRQTLKKLSPTYRSELADRLALRHTPELQFVIDEAVERSIRLGEILREDHGDLGED